VQVYTQLNRLMKMGIEQYIARMCTEVAVYWGAPQNDGEGGMTFDTPIEIACRYEAMDQVVSDSKGNQLTSRAVVYVTQDVDEEGMLYFGSLDDLDSDEVQPRKVSGAYCIKRFEKHPALGSSTEFLRKAYLTPSLSFGSM
jgi:hypothetical protein